MSKQIQLPYDNATGLTTLYALVRNPNTDQVWSVSGGAFVTYIEANRSQYIISLTEDVPGSRHYTADFPSTITAGIYSVVGYLQSGGSPVGADLVKGIQARFEWSGTTVVPLSNLALASIQSTYTGTAQSGSSSTITLDANASNVDDFYLAQWVQIVTGTGAGQCKIIRNYNGTTKVATVGGSGLANWFVNPDNTSTFAIIPNGGANLLMINSDPTIATGLATLSDDYFLNGYVIAVLQSTDVNIITIAGQPANATTTVNFNNLDASITSIKLKTDQLTFSTVNRLDSQVFGLESNTITAAALATNAIDEIFDSIIDGTTTFRQSMCLANSANGGKSSKAGNTFVLRDLADTKDRVTATVTATTGERTAVSRDLT